MTFNEAEINRDTKGQFSEKVGSAAEVSLTDGQNATYAARYFDTRIAASYGDIPSDHLQKQRERYITDVLANPEAAKELDALYNPDSGLTDIDGASIPKPLKNPFRKGQQVVIPAGTVVRFKGEEMLTERKQTVTMHMGGSGYYDEVRTTQGWGNVKVRPPVVTWAGTGGYWKDATVDLDVLEANGLVPEYDAEQVRLWKSQLPHKKLVD